mgnify:CR=1 FL=1
MSKIRINVTVDENLLEKSKKKLGMFGGKLSTLFNAFLNDFVKSAERNVGREEFIERVKDLEKRMNKIEGKL